MQGSYNNGWFRGIPKHWVNSVDILLKFASIIKYGVLGIVIHGELVQL